jgi:hypothetical protein
MLLAGVRAIPAHGYSTGPPDGRCGQPPKFITCRDCHIGPQGDGGIALHGVPADGYEPGAVYPLTIELFDPGQGMWGFEITAMLDATLAQAGITIVTDPLRTQLSDHPDPDPDYLKHTIDGIHDGSPGPVTWDFDWEAPAVAEPVTFYLAGNAANGNGSPSGDYIYALQRPVAPVTAAIATAAESPAAFRLTGAPYPNPLPAGAVMSVGFSMDAPAHIVARIFDVSGRLVAQPLARELLAGAHVLSWDGHGWDGRSVPRGAYFLTLDADEMSLTSRLMVD